LQFPVQLYLNKPKGTILFYTLYVDVGIFCNYVC